MNYQKFLLFGDSITEFAFNFQMEELEQDQFVLAAALANAYTRRMDIVQRGFSGYNSRWGLKILPHILENENNVVLSTIAFGSNDLCLGGHQKVPEDEFVANTREMVSMMKAKGIKVILVGPGLVDQKMFDSKKLEDVKKGYVRTPERMKLYSDLLRQIADEENVAMVDLNEAFQRVGGDNWRELLRDGLHLSGKGYKVYFDELMSTIRKSYPDYAPENLEYKLPKWRDALEDGSNVI